MTRTPTTNWRPLRTERLILREFREADMDDIHAYGSDPEVCRFMLWGPNTPEDSRDFLDRTLAAQKTRPRDSFNIAVELADQGRLLGSVEVRLVDRSSRAGEIGYTFARPAWGQGFTTEAARAMLRHGFERLRLRRIVATCDTRNKGSWRVMEKLGMRREGEFRQDVKTLRGWRDSYLYALLAREWRRGAG